MSLQKKAIIALLIASFFWASAGVAAKTLLKVFDPISLAAIRLTLASLVILPFFIRATPKLSKKLFWDILPVSLFSAGNFLLFLFGINKTTANAAVIIYTATPVVTAFLSKAFIGELVSRKKITGILLGLCGVLIILVLPMIEKNQLRIGDVGGNLLILGAMIMFALFTVGSRHLTSIKHYDPITIIGISLFVSMFIFISLLFVVPHQPIFPALLVPSHFFVAIYLASFVTVLTYILHQWAIKHSSATTGSLTSYIQPVFGFIINGVLLGEIITGGFIVGSVLVFLGSFLATGTQILRMIRKK